MPVSRQERFDAWTLEEAWKRAYEADQEPAPKRRWRFGRGRSRPLRQDIMFFPGRTERFEAPRRRHLLPLAVLAPVAAAAAVATLVFSSQKPVHHVQAAPRTPLLQRLTRVRPAKRSVARHAVRHGARRRAVVARTQSAAPAAAPAQAPVAPPPTPASTPAPSPPVRSAPAAPLAESHPHAAPSPAPTRPAPAPTGKSGSSSFASSG